VASFQFAKSSKDEPVLMIGTPPLKSIFTIMTRIQHLKRKGKVLKIGKRKKTKPKKTKDISKG
jgi:hypothetical protein